MGIVVNSILKVGKTEFEISVEKNCNLNTLNDSFLELLRICKNKKTVDVKKIVLDYVTSLEKVIDVLDNERITSEIKTVFGDFTITDIVIYAAVKEQRNQVFEMLKELFIVAKESKQYQNIHDALSKAFTPDMLAEISFGIATSSDADDVPCATTESGISNENACGPDTCLTDTLNKISSDIVEDIEDIVSTVKKEIKDKEEKENKFITDDLLEKSLYVAGGVVIGVGLYLAYDHFFGDKVDTVVFNSDTNSETSIDSWVF